MSALQAEAEFSIRLNFKIFLTYMINHMAITLEQLSQAARVGSPSQPVTTRPEQTPGGACYG
jgi:hypothetical protein